MTEAHAPGKLVICGEYAVLEAAPAIAMAVAVRARARVAAAQGVSRLQVAGGDSWHFHWDSRGAPQWQEPPASGAGAILEAVAAVLAANGRPGAGQILGAHLIELDSRNFYASGGEGTREKLGLGSSAAVTVALAAALLGASGRSFEKSLVMNIALSAHRLLQDGHGSGVDIAAAVYGGVVALSGRGSQLRLRELAWPVGLHCLPIWSGRGAATAQMLARFEAFRETEPARFSRQIGSLRDIAETALDRWEAGDVGTLLRALTDYDDALRALDSGARLGIYTLAHEELARLAGSAGAVYKTSGAGGGDFGIAFADDAAVISELARTVRAAGFMTLTASASEPGVIVEPE